ncbi:11735_t:CDS:2, partial [Funneliformis geosporum]
IQKPNSQASQHTVPQTPWFVPLPHKSGSKPLFSVFLALPYWICYEGVNNKHDLVFLLENALSQEMEKAEIQENQLLSTDMLNLDREIRYIR